MNKTLTRKIASVYRKSDKLIVKKKDEGVDGPYWIVSDTYSAFMLCEFDYQEFISKYNSYKSTENIPLDAEEYSLPGQNYDSPNFDRVIPDIKRDMDLLETNLKIDYRKVFRDEYGDNLVLLHEKYTDIIPDEWDYVTDETDDNVHLSPVVIKEGWKLKGLIMPVRPSDNSKPAEAIKAELTWTDDK